MPLIDNKALQRYIAINLTVTAIIGISVYSIFGSAGVQDFETWTLLFLACGILNCIIAFSSFFILKKKGVDVYTAKNMLIITLAPLTNLLIPIWLYAKLSFDSKIGTTIVIYSFTIVSFYAYHYGGKRFRKKLGIVAEEDRREAEREEKARKEKEAKGKHE